MALFNFFGKKESEPLPAIKESTEKKVIKITKKSISSNPLLSDAAFSVVDKSILLRELEDLLIQQKLNADSKEYELNEKESKLEVLRNELLAKLNEIENGNQNQAIDFGIQEEKQKLNDWEDKLIIQENEIKVSEQNLTQNLAKFHQDYDHFLEEKEQFEKGKTLLETGKNNDNQLELLGNEIERLKHEIIELEESNHEKNDKILKLSSLLEENDAKNAIYLEEIDLLKRNYETQKSEIDVITNQNYSDTLAKNTVLTELNDSLMKEIREVVAVKVLVDEELDQLKKKLEHNNLNNNNSIESKFEIEKLNAQIVHLQNEVTLANQKVVELESESAEIKMEKAGIIDEISNYVDKLELSNRTIFTLENELIEKNNWIALHLKNNEQDSTKESESDRLQKEIDRIANQKDTQIEKLNNQFLETKEQLKISKKEHNESLKTISRLESKLENLNILIIENEKSRQELNETNQTKINELDEVLNLKQNEISQIIVENSELKNNLLIEKKSTETISKDFEKLKYENQALQSAFENKQSETQEIQEELVRIKSLVEINEQNSKLQNQLLENNNIEFQSKLEAIHTEKEGLETEVNKQTNLISSLENEIESLKQERLSLEKQLIVINQEQEINFSQQKGYESKNAELIALESDLKTKEQVLNVREKELLEIRKDMEEQKANFLKDVELKLIKQHEKHNIPIIESQTVKDNISKEESPITLYSSYSVNIILEGGDTFEAELEGSFTGNDIIETLIDNEIILTDKKYTIFWQESDNYIDLGTAIEELGIEAGSNIKIIELK